MFSNGLILKQISFFFFTPRYDWEGRERENPCNACGVCRREPFFNRNFTTDHQMVVPVDLKAPRFKIRAFRSATNNQARFGYQGAAMRELGLPRCSLPSLLCSGRARAHARTSTCSFSFVTALQAVNMPLFLFGCTRFLVSLIK